VVVNCVGSAVAFSGVVRTAIFTKDARIVSARAFVALLT